MNARKEGYNSQILLLEDKLKNSNFNQKIKIRKQIREIKKKIRLEEANRRNYNAMQNLRHNPTKGGYILTQMATQVQVDIMTNPKEVLSNVQKTINDVIESDRCIIA